jgi:hypothetical protein
MHKAFGSIPSTTKIIEIATDVNYLSTSQQMEEKDMLHRHLA